jgi:hypothetical protein
MVLIIWTRNSPPFIEPEVSLQCSQEFATALHREPAQSSPYLLKVNINITFPSTSRSAKLFLSFRFHDSNFVCFCHLLHACCMFQPSGFPGFNHRYLLKSPNYESSSLCRLLGPKYSPQHLILKHLQVVFFPQGMRSSFKPIYISI